MVLFASNSDVGIDLIPRSIAAVAEHITEHRDEVLLIRCLVADPFGDNHLSVLIYDNLGIVGLEVRSLLQHDPAV